MRTIVTEPCIAALFGVLFVLVAAGIAHADDFDPALDVNVKPIEKYEHTLNITDFGADPTGEKLCDDAFKAALAKVTELGGAKLVLPKGKYKISWIDLVSDLHLHFEDGAEIFASLDPKHYKGRPPLVYGEGLENLAITGKGVIRSAAKLGYRGPGHKWSRTIAHARAPLMLVRCKQVVVEDVTLTDSAGFTFPMHHCERMRITRLNIRNPTWAERENTDGIDLLSCRHVLIEDCVIVTGDDGICFKSKPRFLTEEWDGNHRSIPPMHDVVVRNCTVSSTTNAVKFGTVTVGDFYRILIENIKVRIHPRAKLVKRGHSIKDGRPASALSIMSVDGGHVKDLVVRGFDVDACYSPIFICLADRDNRLKEVRNTPLGQVDGIRVEDFKVASAWGPIQVNQGAREDKPITNILLKNIDVTFDVRGVGKRDIGRVRGYPTPNKVGKEPCWAFYARGVKGLKLLGENRFVNKRRDVGAKWFLVDCEDIVGFPDDVEVKKGRK